MTSDSVNGETGTGIEVRLPEGDETNGLGQVMAQYIEQNCTDFPAYAKRAKRINKLVAIDASDVDVQTTIHFDNGVVTITSGAAENPDMVMGGEWIVMTDIAAGKAYGVWEGMLGRVRVHPFIELFTGARQLFSILKVPKAYLKERGIEMPKWRILHPVAFKVSIGAGIAAAGTGIAVGLEYL